MNQDIFQTMTSLSEEIKGTVITSAEQLEAFRIRFVGSKNVIKALFGEIKNVPNERKKEFGLVLNALKEEAESKFEQDKDRIESTSDNTQNHGLDLTAPVYTIQLVRGTRYPSS
jgi:phenylalanyl-tRNA synthetase alpha chain